MSTTLSIALLYLFGSAFIIAVRAYVNWRRALKEQARKEEEEGVGF